MWNYPGVYRRQAAWSGIANHPKAKRNNPILRYPVLTQYSTRPLLVNMGFRSGLLLVMTTTALFGSVASRAVRILYKQNFESSCSYTRLKPSLFVKSVILKNLHFSVLNKPKGNLPFTPRFKLFKSNVGFKPSS